MNLTAILATGYHHAMHGGDDPAHHHARVIAPDQAQAEIARLSEGRSPIIKRDHVARVKVDYLRRVLALKG